MFPEPDSTWNQTKGTYHIKEMKEYDRMCKVTCRTHSLSSKITMARNSCKSTCD